MIKCAQNKCLCVFIESQRKGLKVILRLYPFNPPRLSMLAFTNAELEISHLSSTFLKLQSNWVVYPAFYISLVFL